MLLQSIPSLLSSIFSITLAVFVLSKNYRRLVNQSFALAMSALAIHELGNFLFLFVSFSEAAIFWHRVSIVGTAFIPGSWLLFSLVFARADPKETVGKWKFVITLFYLLPLGALTFLGSDLFITPQLSESGFIDLFTLGSVGFFFYLFFLLSLIVVMVNLESTLRSSSWDTRWKIKFMILGIGGITAFLLYVTSQILLFSSIDPQFFQMTSIAVLIGGIFILFSIVKNRLLDVDIFISRYVVYNSLTVILVGVYLLTIGLMVEGINYFGEQWNIFAGSIFIFIAIMGMMAFLLSDHLRRKVKLFINRHFYSHKYEFRDKWMEVTERISSKLNMHDIQVSLLDLIAETLGTREVSLWLYNENKRGFIMSMSKNVKATGRKIDHGNDLIGYLNTGAIFNVADIINEDSILAVIYNENRAFFDITKTSLCIPLLVGKELIGFIMVGKEITGEKYGMDDYNLLKAVAKQAAIGILNAQLTEEITTARELEAFSNISSFIMHDLKNAASMLSLLAQNAPGNIDNPEFQQDLLYTLQDTTDKMKGLISRLSNIPREMEIEKQEADIRELVNETLKGLQVDGSKRITIIEEICELPLIKVDHEKIQKVLINLFLNAYEALEKDGKIMVGGDVNGRYVIISVSDNGPGIPEEFQRDYLFKPFKTTKETGFGIGLYQCKEIVEAHRGRIEVESKVGEGTTFNIFLPLN